jgi:hypothetical protein
MRDMSGSNSCFLISRITISIMDATTVQDFILKTFSSSMYHAFSIQVVTRGDCLSHLFFIQFSCRMNAWATSIVGTWLMGETEINDVEIDGGKIGRNQGLLVKRCRFLQESNCASVCVNSCKIPTQNFFQQDMGLPLTMTPDYETFECQFSFGLTPTDANELDAKNTPCLSKCPSSGGMRQWHDASMETSQCSLMDNDNSS